MTAAEMLDMEIEALKKVVEALRQVEPENRERILRSASILLTGKDIWELGGLSREDYLLLGPGLGRAALHHAAVENDRDTCDCSSPTFTTNGRCANCGGRVR